MEGPYTVKRIHINGNLHTLLYEGITEHINICRVLPYHWLFHMPLWRQLLGWVVLRVSLFTSDTFSPPLIWVSCRWSFSESIFCLFIYGRVSLTMEGKSVVPMEITFIDNGGNIFVLCEFIDYENLHIVRSHTNEFTLDEFIWNPYRFLISSLGSPTFFLRVAKRER